MILPREPLIDSLQTRFRRVLVAHKHLRPLSIIFRTFNHLLMELGSVPHQIIEISELTQLVIDHLLLDSPKSLVSLACTCRALEQQALSILWSEQSSLGTLIGSTLPHGTLSPARSPPQVCDV